ncbi:GNAT family N-acetyltransferase [Candidatus Gottesmanbacteria bacterium]|nr:GNAT family N-acetyltransferase [Candidatus Gottesmanbacteria bacterium]
MNITIRQATIKDFKTIQTLNAALFESDSTNDDALDLSWPHSLRGVEYYREALHSPEKITLLAEDNDYRPLGYLIGSARNKFGYRTVKTGELENMYVVPAMRRQGIGRALILKLLVWLKNHKVDRLYVSTYVKNSGGVDFYQNIGFKDFERGLELSL